MRTVPGAIPSESDASRRADASIQALPPVTGLPAPCQRHVGTTRELGALAAPSIRPVPALRRGTLLRYGVPVPPVPTVRQPFPRPPRRSCGPGTQHDETKLTGRNACRDQRASGQRAPVVGPAPSARRPAILICNEARAPNQALRGARRFVIACGRPPEPHALLHGAHHEVGSTCGDRVADVRQRDDRRLDPRPALDRRICDQLGGLVRAERRHPP